MPKTVLPLCLWIAFAFCWIFVCSYINWSSEKKMVMIPLTLVKESSFYKEPDVKLCTSLVYNKTKVPCISFDKYHYKYGEIPHLKLGIKIHH